MSRERRICTLCQGDRCVTVQRDDEAYSRVERCERCGGAGVELLEVAEPMQPQRPRRVWYQLELPIEAKS